MFPVVERNPKYQTGGNKMEILFSSLELKCSKYCGVGTAESPCNGNMLVSVRDNSCICFQSMDVQAFLTMPS